MGNQASRHSIGPKVLTSSFIGKHALGRQATRCLLDQDVVTYHERTKRSATDQRTARRLLGMLPNPADRLPIPPFHPAMVVWELLVLIALTIDLVLRTYLLAFVGAHALSLRSPRWGYPVLLILCDCVLAVDIVLAFVTSVVDTSGTHAETDLRKLALRYASTFFVPDVIAMWPWQVHGASWSLLKLLRLLRLPRAHQRLQPAVVYTRTFEGFNAAAGLYLFALNGHLCSCISQQIPFHAADPSRGDAGQYADAVFRTVSTMLGEPSELVQVPSAPTKAILRPSQALLRPSKALLCPSAAPLPLFIPPPPLLPPTPHLHLDLVSTQIPFQPAEASYAHGIHPDPISTHTGSTQIPSHRRRDPPRSHLIAGGIQPDPISSQAASSQIPSHRRRDPAPSRL